LLPQIEQAHSVTLFKSFNIQRFSVQLLDTATVANSAQARAAAESPQASPSSPVPPTAHVTSSSTIFDTSLAATVAATLSAASLEPLTISSTCTIPLLQLKLNDKQILSLYTMAFALSRLEDKLKAAQVSMRQLAASNNFIPVTNVTSSLFRRS
jgi:hypothetical protein